MNEILTTPVKPAVITSNQFENLTKNIKPIDSVDSVSGLLSNSESKTKFTSNSGAPKFSNIKESLNIDDEDDTIVNEKNNGGHGDSSQPKLISQRYADYIQTSKNDNDNLYISNSLSRVNSVQSPSKRNGDTPITPIINHYSPSKNYDDLNLRSSTITSGGTSLQITNNLSQQSINRIGSGKISSGGSIAIKIETHSPVHLKNTNNLLNDNLSSSQQNIGNHKFNGKNTYFINF